MPESARLSSLLARETYSRALFVNMNHQSRTSIENFQRRCKAMHSLRARICINGLGIVEAAMTRSLRMPLDTIRILIIQFLAPSVKGIAGHLKDATYMVVLNAERANIYMRGSMDSDFAVSLKTDPIHDIIDQCINLAVKNSRCIKVVTPSYYSAIFERHIYCFIWFDVALNPLWLDPKMATDEGIRFASLNEV
ncbi:hypothetical protein VNO77_37675 [Canavalia gladiata]|uniref:Uncharacterized protein n=1 Tax=Canavalia gladiata TaxID=3824 RepID=A0AAN9PWT7_CANGL